ncbi:cilia- and flagella-associated protein 58 [Drosophila grimshawi]|uniref:GH18625 n=1 Tax=Drosophila grimshawi TaxID=7222 RepID=B4JHI6_DROGR|nr:cilia- and flagella-associated protein 58 [Drosophila grimshawi]EDV92813.1 GH18625 [Drosophila grimshawi]
MGDHKKSKKCPETAETVLWRSLSQDRKFDDDIEVAQLDLMDDLDEEFFNTSYELVQRLVPLNAFVAGKIKRYVDILSRMHRRFTKAVTVANAMHTKIQMADTKLKLAIRTTAMSTDMMAKLRESVTEAWCAADAVHLRETLRLDNQICTKPIHLHKGEHPKELRIRGIVFRERDRLAVELKDYEKRLEQNRVYSVSLEDMNELQRETIQKQQQRVNKIAEEMYAMDRKNRITVASLEDKIDYLMKDLESLHAVKHELSKSEQNLAKGLAMNEQMKRLIDRLSQEKYTLVKNLQSLQDDKRRCKKLAKDLETENRELVSEKVELGRLNRANVNEIKKNADLQAMLERRLRQLSKRNNEYAEQKLIQDNELMDLNKKLLITTATLDEALHQKEEGERGRERMRCELANLNDDLAGLRHDLFVQRSRTHDVQLNLKRCHNSLDKKDQQIQKVNREKQELQAEITALLKSIESLETLVAKRTEKLTYVSEQMEQKHRSYHNALMQMENLQSEKKVLEKSFEMCARDRQSLQNLNVKLGFQNNQLCNQLATNEKEINGLKNHIDQMDSTVKHKQNEIHGLDRQLQRMRTELNELKIRNDQLQHTTEADEKRFKQITICLDEVRKEKTLVGHQMVRRNSELRMQREKLAMMKLALEHGNIQYNQRIEDIRLLKTEIRNLRMSNDCMQRAVSGTANLRHEVVRLERQLIRERLHVTAFTEEMKHPYRIHRWRVLIGKDPSKYQLIRKMQGLLKRNIRLAVLRGNLAQQLEDLQRLYDTLKKQLQRMPNPQVVERLWFQQRINQRQSRKVRAMKAELAINEIDLKSREIIIDQYQQVLRKEHQLQQPSHKDASRPLGSVISAPKQQVEQFAKSIFEISTIDSKSSSLMTI